MLANRPESSDSKFILEDFRSKNNDELIANLGNFTHRTLSFVKTSLKGVIPAVTGDLSQDYRELFEAVDLKLLQ